MADRHAAAHAVSPAPAQAAIEPPTPVAIPGLRLRRLDPERDAAAVVELFAVANAHDGVEWVPTSEELIHEWSSNANLDPVRDVIVAEAGGDVVGYVEQDWRIRGGDRVFHQLHPLVRPDLRHRGLGRALLALAEARSLEGTLAGEMGPLELPHVLAGWADLEIADVAPFAAAAGYRTDHFGVFMLRSLGEPIPDAPLPEGLEVRPVEPSQHRQIWDADAEAFRDHRDPAERTDADFERWFTLPALDTSLWEVAWDGDEVAGSVMNFVYAEENERLGLQRGILEHISVRRPWRKRGLASALIVRSLRRFRDMGLDQAALGADAENLTGAVRLYEALGFRRDRTAAAYRKALELPEG